MSFLQKILDKLSGTKRRERVAVAPAEGYNLWSEQYDEESWNLMVALDEDIFSSLLEKIDLKDKVILDIGCGTGRHWAKLLECGPRSLTGFDVSSGMLERLKAKYPDADARLMNGWRLDGIVDESADLIVSTLAFAHFPDMEAVMQEWSRVLKPGGHILLTDAHPESFAKGADITFNNNSTIYEVAHYIYPLDKVRRIAAEQSLEEMDFRERAVDIRVMHVYESQNAMATYHKFEGVPLIYGIHFRKHS